MRARRTSPCVPCPWHERPEACLGALMPGAAGLVVVAAGAPGVAPPVGDADGEADRRLLGRAARGERAEVDERDVQERAADVHPHGVGVVRPAGAGQDHAVGRCASRRRRRSQRP